MGIFNESKNVRNQRKKLNIDYVFKHDHNYPKDFTYEQKKKGDRWIEKARDRSGKINYFTDKMEVLLNKKFKSDLSLLSKILKIDKPLYIVVNVDMGYEGKELDRINFVITDNVENFHYGTGPTNTEFLLYAHPNKLVNNPVHSEKWSFGGNVRDSFFKTQLNPEAKKVLNSFRSKISSEFIRLMKIPGYFKRNYSVNTNVNEEFTPTYFNY